jgi:hypothetical protein
MYHGQIFKKLGLGIAGTLENPSGSQGIGDEALTEQKTNRQNPIF